MSCTAKLEGQCVTQGNDWFLDITVTTDGVISDDTGLPTNPKDLTGASVVLTLKETKDGAVVVTPVSSISDPTNGAISFSMTAAVTEGLISAGEGSRVLTGAPQVTYADGTVDDLFEFDLEIHESWN